MLPSKKKNSKNLVEAMASKVMRVADTFPVFWHFSLGLGKFPNAAVVEDSFGDHRIFRNQKRNFAGHIRQPDPCIYEERQQRTIH